MSRRAAIKSKIKSAAAAIEAAGLKPHALDVLPSGGIRFYFAAPEGSDLDRELDEFIRAKG
jgi:hypothetical protein